MKMNGADAILRSLEAEGVEVMFGIPGGAIMPTYDAMARGTTVRHVLARHEQGAGHMAQGYARASGRVGVAIATSGPGATNLVTPIADAWMDSTPLVCITGQVRTTLIGTDAFQECDITGITMPIVKHSWLVQDVKEIAAVMKAAFHVARTGRCGPVLVDVPRDIQEAEVDFSYPGDRRPARLAAAAQGASAADPRGRPSASRSAEKPVLYVGGGTINGDACDELRELAEAGGLPVITTLMGKGAFPETHPLLLRLARHARHEVVEHRDEHVRRARRDRRPLRRPRHRQALRVRAGRDGRPPRHRPGRDLQAARRRHPRRRPAEEGAGRARRPRSASTAQAGVPAPEAWVHKIEEWRDEFPLRYGTGGDWLKPQKLMETLQALTAGDDVIFTTGVGQHQMWAMQYLLTERPRNFITSGGLGTMGYGIPAAIGAKAARPEATVVCVDGDGCFQMTAQELTTAVIDDLPIIVVLVNNGYLGMVTQWQDMFFDGRRSHVGLGSRGAGLRQARRGVRRRRHARRVGGRARAGARARRSSLNRTVVIDCRVDPAEQCFPMIPAGAAAIDMVEYEEPVEATP